jgi:hypothetical protein
MPVHVTHCLSGCVTLAPWHVTGRLTCPAPLLYTYTQVQYQRGTGGELLYVKKPAETLGLASGLLAIKLELLSPDHVHVFRVRPDLFAMEKPPSFLSDPWNKDNYEDHALFCPSLFVFFSLCSKGSSLPFYGSKNDVVFFFTSCILVPSSNIRNAV